MNVTTATTFLFVPANRPERFAKAVESGADVVVVDLEDAVLPADKRAARSAVKHALEGGLLAVVRINSIGTEWFDDDLDMVVEAGGGVMLPKCSRPEEAQRVRRDLPSDRSLIALIETARGVGEARTIASVRGVDRLALGHIDLSNELGIDPDTDHALLFARSALVFASSEHALPPPVDGVTTQLDNPEVLQRACQMASSVGFSGKLCIHPRQVPIAQQAFAPSGDELAWAQRVLAVRREGLAVVDGKMVDEPVFHRAERVLRRGGLL